MSIDHAASLITALLCFVLLRTHAQSLMKLQHIVEENIVVESIGYTEGEDFFADSSDHEASITANKPEPPVSVRISPLREAPNVHLRA